MLKKGIVNAMDTRSAMHFAAGDVFLYMRHVRVDCVNVVWANPSIPWVIGTEGICHIWWVAVGNVTKTSNMPVHTKDLSSMQI